MVRTVDGFELTVEAGELRAQISVSGGINKTQVRGATHLVATERDFKNQSVKGRKDLLVSDQCVFCRVSSQSNGEWQDATVFEAIPGL